MIDHPVVLVLLAIVPAWFLWKLSGDRGHGPVLSQSLTPLPASQNRRSRLKGPKTPPQSRNGVFGPQNCPCMFSLSVYPTGWCHDRLVGCGSREEILSVALRP